MRRSKTNSPTDKPAREQIEAFSRCVNYPRDENGVELFAEAMQNAASHFGVPLDRLIARCAAASDRCPTDFEIRIHAQCLKDAKESGDNAGPRECPMGICDGSGWIPSYWLHTWAGKGKPKRERITEEVARKIGPDMKFGKQMIYSGVEPCECRGSRATTTREAEAIER